MVFYTNHGPIRFNVWDTAGQEKYHSLAHMYYKDASVAVLVYDIHSKITFERMKVWVDELRDKAPHNVFIFIAGNKSDVTEGEEVTLDEAMKFATSVNAPITLTSAKDATGIKELFMDIARKVAKKVSKPKGNPNHKSEHSHGKSSKQTDDLAIDPTTSTGKKGTKLTTKTDDKTGKKGGCCK